MKENPRSFRSTFNHMNKKVIFILFLTVAALAVLYLYSFGPLAGVRTAGNFNPASLHPSSPSQSANPSASSTSTSEPYAAYHNKDIKENYYAVELPQGWQVSAGKDPGSYAVVAPNANAQVGLQDVPDNSTLELYILSQDEPKLKTSLLAYSRVDYKKTSINGNDAYELIYTSKIGNDVVETVRTYISGQDHAGLIVLNSKQQDFQSLQPIFNSIIGSFNWENK